ncbi:MAG: hypothetical protein FWD02_00760 [Bacteroidales bacterium]|nr:hypothetical protein [Bacteroidales bacterium]
MKKIAIFSTLTILILLSGCVVDRSNRYELEINELELRHPMFGTGFVLMQDNPLVVIPEIVSNLGYTDESNYTFEWMAIVHTFSPTPEMFIPIGTERNLHISEIGSVLTAGQEYVVRLRVTDITTGVFAQASFLLRVNEVFSSGWLVMNEIDDQGDGVRMRLDMLELRARPYLRDTLLFHKDVLQAAGSQLPMEARGRPIGMRVFTDQLLSPNRVAFYILTETGSNRLSHATFMETMIVDGEITEMAIPVFSWRQGWSLRNHFMLPGQVPDGLFAEAMHTSLGIGTVVAAQGNLYRMHATINVLFGDPINRLVGGQPTFTASNHIAGTGIVFDLDSRSFRQVTAHNQLVRPIDEGTATPSIIARFISYENMANYDLVTMFDNAIRPGGAPGAVYIIMRNRTNGQYWLMQSDMATMRQDIWEELGNRQGSGIGDGASTQTRISQAAQQDRPLFLGGGFFRDIFYYAVGGTIYAYDIALGESIPMVERPGKTVTFMSFLPPGDASSHSLAGERPAARDMLVGFWDGTQGTLEQFEVQNREFIPQRTDFHGSPETNFGKIIDVLRRR